MENEVVEKIPDHLDPDGNLCTCDEAGGCSEGLRLLKEQREVAQKQMKR